MVFKEYLPRIFALGFVLTTAQPLQAEEDKFKFNGYMTAAVAVSDEDKANYFGISDTPSFNSDSMVAVQAEAKINEKASATVQLIARGIDDYKVEAEWMFLSYKAMPDLSARAGRMRLPVYMNSDYVEVGYAYPWVRPPFEVYGLVPIFAFDGIDLYYTHSYGEWTFNLQPFFGSSNKDVTIQRIPTSVSLHNIWGAATSVSNGWATLRLGHAQFEADLEMPSVGFKEEERDAGLSSLGVELKPDNWLIMAEYVKRYAASQAVSDMNAWYLMGAYRIDNLMPNITFASARNNNSVDRNQTDQDSITAGVRWDFMENMAIKFEGEFIDVKNGTIGGITFRENISVWSIAVDTVF